MARTISERHILHCIEYFHCHLGYRGFMGHSVEKCGNLALKNELYKYANYRIKNKPHFLIPFHSTALSDKSSAEDNFVCASLTDFTDRTIAVVVVRFPRQPLLRAVLRILVAALQLHGRLQHIA